MNYRHAFHAGNFADVLKHAILARLLAYMTRKDAPLFYLDTHAGVGAYDLFADEATRTGEWTGGFGRLEEAEIPADVADLLSPYLDAVKALRLARGAGFYPGSPALARHLLRGQDRLVLCELHPEDAASLRRFAGRDERLRVVEIDGYTALGAYVPPKEKRGLVLVDPPFEQPDEFGRMTKALVRAHRKWPTGSYAFWYPVKGDAGEAFRASLAETGLRRVLRLECEIGHDGPAPRGGGLPLTGTGMIVVNPPYTLAQEAQMLLPWLAQLLRRSGEPRWIVDEIAGE